MKNKALKILNLILALFLAVFSISYVFAWFADGTKVPLNINGQASAYFAYGDGLSEETAFGITEPIHLYNLSWLQNSGKFDDTTYYFEINENLEGALDMSGYWLAPIGNFEHPFKGVFNGSGKTIKGLQVTTNKSLLQSNDPAKYSSYLFSNAVGFFGKTGSSAQIRNFILDNPKVEVEAGDEMYCSTTETGTDGQVVDTKVVGFAVGEDNGSTTDGTTTTAAISNIGVIGGVLSVQRADYQTKNAIIGSTALQGTTDGDTTSGNTGYFDPSKIWKAVISNNSVKSTYTNLFEYSSGELKFINDRWIVPKNISDGSLGELSLGAFSIATSNRVKDPSNIQGDESRTLSDSDYYPSTNDLTKEEIQQYLEPDGGWDKENANTFNYYYDTGNAPGDDEAVNYAVYTEDGSSANQTVTLGTNAVRSIKMNVFEMDRGNPSILLVATSNGSSERTLSLYEYKVIGNNGGEIQYSDYSKFSFETLVSTTPVETFTTDGDNKHLSIFFVELENKNASYGLTVDGRCRIYFMRVVGVAGTDTYGEGSLDSIDFIAEGDTMVYSNGTVTFNYVETGTLIGLSGNGASIIIGFIREATTVGEGDSATTTYTFSVTYSAVVATEPGSTYSPNPTVSNVVTVGENESFTGSEDSLFPGSLSS